MVFSWVFLVHIPLVFTVGSVEWMGVFEALGISGVALILLPFKIAPMNEARTR